MTVSIEPWSSDDLWLLQAINAREMTEHLGGPETPEKVVARHERYLRIVADGGTVFAVLLDGERVGNCGLWASDYPDGVECYEMGWAVLPAFQGRGVATSAVRLVIDVARERREFRLLHAFPNVHNAASNAVCRKAGFSLVGPTEVEYPAGSMMAVNDWVVDLDA